jgi:outer membrane protein assembly factor BamB
MTVIELGLVTGGDPPPVTEQRRPRNRREIRRLLVAAVAALCLLTVTGSAPIRPGGLERLWSIPFHQDGDTFAVAGGAVFVLTTLGQPALTAYDLRSGAQRWTNPGFADVSWLGSSAAGVMLLPAGSATVQHKNDDGSYAYREFNRDTVAVEMATGRQLWREPGDSTMLSGGRVLLADWNAAGSTVTRLRTVRIRDGATIWSRPATGLEAWTTGATPGGSAADRLVTATSDGRIEVVDLADGRLVSSGRVPWARQSERDNRYTSMTLDDHRIYIDKAEGGRSQFAVYDTETLRKLWAADVPESGGIYPCGPVLCLNLRDATAGYDRDTGEVRWRIAGATNGFPLPGGRLLVEDDDAGARHLLIDARTGRRLADLEATVPVWNYRTGDTPYLLGHTRQPLDLTSVSRFDARSGEVLMRGAIPRVVDWGCANEGDLLACVTVDDHLAVTDVG